MDEIEKRCAHSYIDPYRLIVMPAHQQRFLDNVAKVQANRNEWEDIVAYRWSKKFQPKTTLKKERSFLELKDLLMKTAEELEIGVDLIAGLREIVKLIQKKPSKLYYGWRYEVFGKKAMELA